ncbi:ecto-NOX disulfide-thiol exchanger 2 isoform X1 [Nerophis ophidion]|uniref:ecto-NOX disulfide-thiol exchanger 2 isoform X1 n=2 Tax=Nerophis ophidion TaxID=159077 RepID=UPI002ADF029C|nr:ecto-NOX disulfide-thiol exchanger 2 isoform X1 [Nerophis ophidion]XP_061747587.1 ecto-NOX disulfide-thiol exchanger 2 isoform X1 [Nerophis ophidion]XP_061747588.1 ecto-NOX disulfide-thiol exchanger 2 isoform X1 [Nerophis ophidion]XP_061747589.1 ecto-NOX disulfide-thiol exchanger 2 isoform X1 [Nerophis ophidion]
MYTDYRASRVTGLNTLPFDPSSNNDPLHFNNNGGSLLTECPPLENSAENSKKRKRASLPPEGIHNMPMESSSLSMPMSDPNAWATAMNNLGMPPMGITGQPLMPDFDPSLGMMPGIAPINPMMPGLGMVPPPLSHEFPVVKEIIHCKTCTLFPPNPNLPPPATRDRPPGCKTVFVGGLPENATEQLIMEVFGQCGDITAIRKSKKNFCHIRFAEEFNVDNALFLSGYRIRLGSSTDNKDTGRLHVDFAQARDDLYEWECHQRMMAREERHRRRMQEDLMRPPSPPPIVHFSEHECSQLGDKIKDDGQFAEAVRVLLTWLERGEVNRRNANTFYSMIQSSNSHIRRLMMEKSQHEKEMEEAKEKFKTALSGILAQFEQIVSVFQAASKQKAWDHFSKAQRKSLDVWRKQAEEIRNMHNEQLMDIRREEEMEMSDDDMEECPDSKDSEDSGVSQAEALKEENDSLRCQLDAYRNEVELLKQEQGKNQPVRSEEESTHSQQLSFLQQALQGMQKQLLKMREELKQREAELDKSLEDKQELNQQVQTLKEGLQNLQKTQLEGCDQDESVGGEEAANQAANQANELVSCSQEKEGPTEKRQTTPVHSEREALLVGIISTFLHVHPFGASIEYICSYLQRLDTKINPTEVEALLSRLPCTFKQELTGVGASLEKRWNFCGFQGIKSM